MAPLSPPRRPNSPRSALPFILFRTVLLMGAVIGVDVVTGGGIRRGLSEGSDVSITRAGARAVLSMRGTIDAYVGRTIAP